MDLNYSQEESAFRDEVRGWLKANLPQDLRDKVANYEELSRDDLLRWHKILAKKGWVAPSWPKEFGGTDWNVVQRYIFEEECGFAGTPPLIPFGLSMCGPVLLRFQGAQADQVSGAEVVIVLGDAAGHGVKACMSMMTMHTLISMIRDRRFADTAEFVTEVNRRLCNSDVISADQGGFITLLYCTLDAVTHRFEWTSTGHPMPLLQDLATNEIHKLGSKEEGGLPLIIDEDWEYEKCEIQVPPNCRILLYTDGLDEAFPQDGKEQDQFGETGIIKTLKDSIDLPLVDALERLFHDSAIYSAAALQITHSTVSDNNAEGGGGLFDTGSHTTTIKGSTFSGNHATGGGGITSRPRVTIFLSNSTISGNTAKDAGAGVHSNGPVDLTNCTGAFKFLPPREEGEEHTVAPLESCGGESGEEGGTSHGNNGGAGLNVFAKGRFTMRNTLLVGNAAGDRQANCGKTGGGSQPFIIYISRGFNLEDADTCGLDQPGDMNNVKFFSDHVDLDVHASYLCPRIIIKGERKQHTVRNELLHYNKKAPVSQRGKGFPVHP